jgi:hypothetical protein
LKPLTRDHVLLAVDDPEVAALVDDADVACPKKPSAVITFSVSSGAASSRPSPAAPLIAISLGRTQRHLVAGASS